MEGTIPSAMARFARKVQNVDLPASMPPTTITTSGFRKFRDSDNTSSTTVPHIDVPADEESAHHFLPPRPVFAYSLHCRPTSNGRDLPDLTEIVRHDTSIPRSSHLPRTATTVGPLTIHTLLFRATPIDTPEHRKNSLFHGE
jgi:hypothetical protein